MERATGIEPAHQPWEGCILPLNYARIFDYIVSKMTNPYNIC